MALDPTIIVLFGGAGDLVWRKLIPLVSRKGSLEFLQKIAEIHRLNTPD